MKSTILNLERQINEAQQRLNTLSHRCDEPHAEPLDLLPQALEELSNALEELHVSADELQARSDELLLARDAVERERQRYLELFDLAPDGYLVSDAVGRIIEANHAAAALFQRPQQFLVGKPLSVFVAPTGHSELYELLHRMQRGTVERINGQEIHLLLHDGTEADIAVTAVTVRDRSGQVSAIRWLLHDITERKQTDQRLADTQRQLELIMETVPDIIYTLDLETRLVRWNRRLETATGLSPQELQGRHAESFFSAATRATVGAAIRRALATGFAEDEAELLHKNGEPMVYQFTAAPLTDSQGQVVGVAGTGHDITHRKRNERNVLQLSRRLMQIQDDERRRLGRELHDSTAQNLVGLAMNLSIVNRGREQLEPATRRALDESLVLVDRSLEEIRTIAYLLHPPLLDEVGLASAIRWYTEGFMQRSGIRVDLAIAPDLGRLSEDVETALFRVVQECLTNVHRHSGSPSVRVQILCDARTVTLEVIDEGRGFMVEGGSNPAALGVGIMGMHERMTQLGGQLEISSGTPGFTVRATVPLIRADT